MRMMLDKAVELKVCLDALGCEINMNSFDSRLMLQKCTYLLQACGVNLGYGFNWYLRGPYSSYLADVGFYASREIDTVTKKMQNVKLKKWAVDRINVCKKLIYNSRPKNVSALDWVELLASLYYLKNDTAEGKRVNTSNELLTLLKDKKSWYDDDVISYAITKLKGIGLINFDA